MNYDERLQNVSVLGAAGKMGSGILLLTAVEMTDLSLKPENKDMTFVLNAIDVSNKGLAGLMGFLRTQVQKLAEKKTVWLRTAYADRQDLIENQDFINQYVFDVLSVVRPVTTMDSANDSTLVFEAISENKDLKVKLLSQIDKNNSNTPWFFTNTSSVPINIIDEEAELGGRILGFHFYNPPAVQRLVELIVTSQTNKEMEAFSREYAKKLRKVIVPSNDFAGFIGNGHFMRDALHGLSEVEQLTKDMPFAEAVYMINKVSQDYLIRPMGIFQLIDYVGIDVVSFIMAVMDPFQKDENLRSDVLNNLIEMDVTGGQFSDGSQKDGFLKYEKNRPVAIFDPEKKGYIDIASFKDKCDEKLGPLPKSYYPWKVVNFSRGKKAGMLDEFFAELKTLETAGAALAIKYGSRSKEIGKKLVTDNVAHNEDDVNTVMLTGFFHAYGPINNYFD